MLKKRHIMKLANLWPPFWGSSIGVRSISPEWDRIRVQLKMRPWNKNYFGTHYGGSLFSLCDPWFCLIMTEGLGRGYTVWDKEASIRFRKPGRGTVEAEFHIPREEVERVRAAADSGETAEPEYTVEIKDIQGVVVAEVTRKLWIKKTTRGDKG